MLSKHGDSFTVDAHNARSSALGRSLDATTGYYEGRADHCSPVGVRSGLAGRSGIAQAIASVMNSAEKWVATQAPSGVAGSSSGRAGGPRKAAGTRAKARTPDGMRS